ncbi:MAG: ribosome assembly cofactor RimP [Bacteroidales bacterium]|nr:ribosome assembly cofactor RimP [Bacteroidales bacterium]
MIDKNKIEEVLKELIAGSGIFPVSVKVSSSNRIVVLIDRNSGITLDECVDIHRGIEERFDRDEEDYELQVSSPGLDAPFAVIEQYMKNEGRKVEVLDNDGKKYTGLLKNVTAGGFELETEIKIKGKPKETAELSFNFEQVKYVKTVLTVK